MKGITHQNQQIIVQQNNNCNKEREGTNNPIPTVKTERNGDKRPLEADTGGTAPSRNTRFTGPHGNSAGGAQSPSRKEDNKSAGDRVFEHSGNSLGDMDCYPTPSPLIKTRPKDAEKETSNRRRPKRDNSVGRTDPSEYQRNWTILIHFK